MRFFRYALCASLLLAVTACGGGKTGEEQSLLLPMPPIPAVKDPDNAQFMDAISQYVAMKKGAPHSRYEFTRIDLNDDGRRDGIVLMKSPNNQWCNINGCLMAVFQAVNDGFYLTSEIAPVRGPLVVSDNRTNGWRDIVVTISGRSNIDAYQTSLSHDGTRYPARPENAPQIYAGNITSGTKIFP